MEPFSLIKQIGHLLVYATECDVSLCNFGQIELHKSTRMPTKTFLLNGVSAGLCWYSICPNCEMYLPKLRNVFVQIVKCIFPNQEMYFGQIGLHQNANKNFSLPAQWCVSRGYGGRINFSPVANMVTNFKNEKLIQQIVFV